MEADDNLVRRSVEDVFADFNGRRSALIKALTTDVEDFFRQCDPARENLCLYGLPSGQWQVTLPAERLPTDLPEPTLGINFSRDGGEENHWLDLVAVHSDSWLLSVASCFGTRFRFDKVDRQRLFDMINDLPTVYEAVVEARQSADRSSVTKIINTKPNSISNVINNPNIGANDEDEGTDEENVEHDNSLCGACGEKYGSNEFWIYCNFCERWFHGKCVKITPEKAEDIKKYKCPDCINKRARP